METINRILCVDVVLTERKHQRLAAEIFTSVVARGIAGSSNTDAALHIRGPNRQYVAKREEVNTLESIAQAIVPAHPDSISVDGLFSSGINAAVVSTDQEYEQIRSHPDCEIIQVFEVGKK